MICYPHEFYLSKCEYRDPHPVWIQRPQCMLTSFYIKSVLITTLISRYQDPGFSDSIRHVMDGSLPNSLKHVISNAEYYGPSLFLLATDVVTAYVFQEPSLLSSLQVPDLYIYLYILNIMVNHKSSV